MFYLEEYVALSEDRGYWDTVDDRSAAISYDKLSAKFELLSENNRDVHYRIIQVIDEN